MDHFIIKGGNRLSGTVEISGAKNSALKLMCAALLTPEPVILHNVPELADITSMARLLAHLGMKMSSHENNTITLQSDNIHDFDAPYELVSKMRASIIVLGPLLARFGQAKVSLPGGCAIGTRPVDMHLKALEQMGAKIEIEAGYVNATCPKLQGAEIFFEKVSVGATENTLMAATLAEGVTILHNAAREPEITDLANMLIKMGAKIEGAGQETIKITGVKSLSGVEHTTVKDRIEAGSFILAAAITGGEITIPNMEHELLGASWFKMKEAGIELTQEGKNIRAKASGKFKATDVLTAPFPGFATDMQAQFMTLMCIANGTSTIDEVIFENRFMHAPELARMGADIKISGHTAVVKGIEKLKGAEVMATDLRASFSLVIAALAAEGETKINRVYHIDRGYEKIVRRLAAIGADIKRIKVEKA